MKKKIAVVYKSKYGATKRYAEWIAAALEAELFEAGVVKPAQLTDFDLIIYGGGLYASGISGVKLVTKISLKNLIVFTVGLADPVETDYTAILNENFTPELLSKIKIFHLRGGIDYANLSAIHKIAMAAVKKTSEKKPEEQRTSEDKAMLATYGAKIDFTDKEAIRPIVDHARSILN